VFLLLLAVAARSRVLVRRRLTARALVAAAPHQQAADAAPAHLSHHDVESVWLLRRLVLAEVIIALVVLAVTALLGITTPPTTG
jgi:hypothetical protein